MSAALGRLLSDCRAAYGDPYIHTRWSRSQCLWEVIRSPHPKTIHPYRKTFWRILARNPSELVALETAIAAVESRRTR